MDPKIAARFTDAHLQAAMQRYNIPAGQSEALDGFESFIYKFQRPDGQFVLRIGHSEQRSENLIRGEVDWINYLAAFRWRGPFCERQMPAKEAIALEKYRAVLAHLRGLPRNVEFVPLSVSEGSLP